MRTTVELPDPLFRRAKLSAVERGISFKTLLTEALEEKIAAAAPVRRRMDAPPVPKTGRRVIRALTNAQTAELLAEEDIRKGL